LMLPLFRLLFCFNTWTLFIISRVWGYNWGFFFASIQVLLGDMGAGKSSLVLRFVKGQFHDYQVRGSIEWSSKHTYMYKCIWMNVFMY
jgi:hypothetical protein